MASDALGFSDPAEVNSDKNGMSSVTQQQPSLSIAAFFDADVALLKSMKESILAKVNAEKQYMQQLEVIVRASRKAVPLCPSANEPFNIWQGFTDDLGQQLSLLSSNVTVAEKLAGELQAISNIRENQKKMLETELSAIMKFIQKEWKKYLELKKDLSRLYEICTAGMNSIEKLNQKGKITDKEKSLLEHNVIRLHETHNACLLASMDVKHAQELADNVHLPAMRRFMEAAYEHYLSAIISIFKRLAELQQAQGQQMVKEAEVAIQRLSSINPHHAAKAIPQIRLSATVDANTAELVVTSVYQKPDPRLTSVASEKFCVFTETENSVKEAISHLESDITGQVSKQQRLETSISEKRERLHEYMAGDDNTISGAFARRCEIAKLESELNGIDAVKSSFSLRISFIQSCKVTEEPVSSIITEIVAPLTKPVEESKETNTIIPQSPSANALIDTSTEGSIGATESASRSSASGKAAKSKVSGFFKTVRRNIVSKIKHEKFEGDPSDEENTNSSHSNGQTVQQDANGRSNKLLSDDGSNESSNGDDAPFWHTQVRDLPYFHGILPRNDIESMFQKSGNKNGDFLIRESLLESSREKVLILSVYWDQPRHFRMASQSCHKTSWRLIGPRDFASISDLIRYHTESGERVAENLDVKLVRPLSRTSDFLQNEWIVLGRILGQGAYGAVYVGKFQPPSSSAPMDVAVKVLKPQLLTMSKDEKAVFINEGRQMQHLNHPNIVQFIGVAASREPMMLVMELCLGGSLLALLRTQGTNLPVSEMYRFSYEAASGMEYLSKMRLIHRDLAARNCLITDDKILKISDFGLSRSTQDASSVDYMEEAIYQPRAPVKIPIRWTAPETFLSNIYTSSTDVWSFGILLWEIFAAGTLPWPECRNNDRARDAVQSGEQHPKPDRMPTPFYESVMLKCLTFDAEYRLTFSAARSAIERFVSPSDGSASEPAPPAMPPRPKTMLKN